MNSVFIVDDEFNIVNLITHLVDWDALHLHLVGTATDSLSALQQIRTLKPDILIADINMPGMSGLELLEESLKCLPELKAIVVSGYQDFSYAYKAIKFGVKDYLLKPISREELNKALSRLISTQFLNGSTTSSHEYIHELESKIHSSSLRLRKQYLNGILKKDPSICALSMEDVNSSFEFNFQSGLFVVCLLILDKREYASSLRGSICSQVENRCRDLLTPFVQEWDCLEQEAQMLFLFNIASGQKEKFNQKLDYFFAHVQSIVSAYQVLEVTLGVGAYTDTFAGISLSCMSALRVVNARTVLGRNRLLFAESLRDQGDAFTLTPFYKSDMALEASNRETFRSLAAKDLRKLHAFLSENPTHAFLLYKNYLEQFFEAVYKEFGFPTDLTTYKKEAFLEVDEQESLTLLDEVVYRYLDRMFDLIQGSKNSDKRIVIMAKAYIEENSAGPISLESVAQHVHLSPTYFGVLFKKETSVNFTDYLVSIRIEKAKELLKGFENNVSEIAQMVGYSNVKHFSRKFKSIVGVTPHEYRKIYHIYD